MIGVAAGTEGDWPHLRGPTYSAVSAERDLAETWPAEGPPVLWRIELGHGYSGFVVAGDRAYTMYQALWGQYLVCLDVATGTFLWRRRVDGPSPPPNGHAPWPSERDWPGPMATPTVSEGRVYFVSSFGLAGCADARDGRLLWSLQLAATFGDDRCESGTEFGYACSPLVEAGKVYLPVGGKAAAVVALNASDGSVAWRSGDYAASYSPALPLAVGGTRQIAVFLRELVVGFESATGRELWRHEWHEGYDEHASWLVYEEPFLLVASAFGHATEVLRLGEGPGGPTVEPVWRREVLSNDVCSSLALGGYVYGFDLQNLQASGKRPSTGTFKCLRLATGEVAWETDRTGHTGVIAADGKLILLNELGELILARATPDAYEELGRMRVFPGRTCWTPPALARGRLFVRNHAEAVCVYVGLPERMPAPPDERTRLGAGLCADFGRRLEKAWTNAIYAPPVWDALRWYWVSLIAVFLPATVLVLVGRLFVRRARSPRAGAWLHAGYWAAAFVLGVLAGPLLTPASGTFVFTWPAGLFAVFQALFLMRGRQHRWEARGLVVAFAGLCLCYYAACGSLFVMAGRAFLTGLLPAFPAAWWAARRMRSAPGLARAAGWSLASFSAYFWIAILMVTWGE